MVKNEKVATAWLLKYTINIYERSAYIELIR